MFMYIHAHTHTLPLLDKWLYSIYIHIASMTCFHLTVYPGDHI